MQVFQLPLSPSVLSVRPRRLELARRLGRSPRGDEDSGDVPRSRRPQGVSKENNWFPKNQLFVE